MHYKIEKSGCVEHKGLCQVRADFYYDEKYKEYALTPVKIYPDEGYPGKVDELGTPVDVKDYQAWEDSLQVEMLHLPFHTHFIYFEPTHTDEEILYCFEIAKQWLKNNQKMKNVKPVFSKFPISGATALCETRISEIKTKDFSAVKNADKYSVK